METVLKLSIGGLPPLSARGCTQTLVPLPSGQQERTINGKLIHWGEKGIKYFSHIQCQDHSVLATEGLHPGADVDVECIQPLWQRFDSNGESACQIQLERDPVEGSIIAFTSEREPLDVKRDGKTVKLPNIEEPIFVSYRPRLHMKVRHYELFTNEWGLSSGWKLDLEEI